jgi:hypothetical protein
MIDLVTAAIYMLATWRVASLFVNERGPGDVFLRLRRWAGIEHDDSGLKTIIPDNFVAGLLSCVWCCSVWVGGFWMLFDWAAPWIAIRLGMALAFSTGAILVERWMGS